MYLLPLRFRFQFNSGLSLVEVHVMNLERIPWDWGLARINFKFMDFQVRLNLLYVNFPGTFITSFLPCLLSDPLFWLVGVLII